MGGRISDIALDPVDPRTYYVALATGGLMKTTDQGGSFKGVFDGEAVASTGAVAVAPRPHQGEPKTSPRSQGTVAIAGCRRRSPAARSARGASSARGAPSTVSCLDFTPRDSSSAGSP